MPQFRFSTRQHREAALLPNQAAGNGTDILWAILPSGLGAAITVGLRKPMAAMLVALRLIGSAAMAPLLVGTLIGWGISKLAPTPELH